MKLSVSQFGKNIFDVTIEDFELLNGAEVFIGRSDKCHVILDDQTLSRKHAKVFYKDNELYVESLSGFKKIELNGQESQQSILSLKDKVVIGSFTIVLEDWDYQSNRRDSIESVETEDRDDKTEVLQETDRTEVLDSPLDINSNDELSSNDESTNSNDSAIMSDGFQDLEQESSGEVLDENPFTEDVSDDISSDESFKEEEFKEDAFNEDEAFSDEGFADDGFSDDSFSAEGLSDGESTKVFQNFASYSLRLLGDFSPFDRFAIDDEEVSIGRSLDKCQIVLDDPEVSGVHAKIKKNLVNLTLEDNDSSNGTIVNGERINKIILNEGDQFQVGSTTFFVEVSSELISKEKDVLMPVDLDQEIEVEEVIEEEVAFGEMDNSMLNNQEDQEKSIIKRIMKNPAQRKKLLYGGVILFGLWLFLEDDTVPSASEGVTDKKKDKVAKVKTVSIKKNHPPEVLEKLEENYALGDSKFQSGEYYEAKEYLDIVYSIDSDYKNVKTLLALVQEGFDKKLKLKAEEQAEKERKQRQLKVEKLMKKVRKAVKDRSIQLAETLFGQVLEIDPENIDIPQLKIELDAYKDEKERLALEKKRKETLRQSMVDSLAVGKKLFLREEWFKAINELEKFIQTKKIDEDLIKSATDMIKTSKQKIASIVEPLSGKARAYKEGQDLKRAYETYGEILKYDPANEEALNERDSILEKLNTNSMKIYREALISESLSLFEEAKEKYQQVQQISPLNSDYYNKATEKLKKYTD